MAQNISPSSSSQIAVVLSTPVEPWYCHCCGFKNKDADAVLENCKVCGRHESYALEGYPLPLHGKGGALFRPSQIITVLTQVDETDDVNWTPLHNACVTGNTAAALKLMELNAHIEAATDKGQTPLHLAVYAGSQSTVQALLKHGANPNATTRFELNTPVHLACEAGWRAILNDLLGASGNPNALNRMDRTPLHLAALIGRADMGASLIREGADLLLKDVHGWNARQLAELRNNRAFVELLVRNTQADKMAVLKEMPPAEWHCQLWSEVVASTQKSHRDEIEAQRKIQQFQEEVRIARSRMAKAAADEAEVKRQQVLAERARAKVLRERALEDARRALAEDDAVVQEHTLAAGMAFGAVTKTIPRKDGFREGSTRRAPPASLLGLDSKGMKELENGLLRVSKGRK